MRLWAILELTESMKERKRARERESEEGGRDRVGKRRRRESNGWRN